MSTEATETQEERAALRSWASVFLKPHFSTGGFEICITLTNISETSDSMDEETAAVLRDALRRSVAWRDRSIMADVKAWRTEYPRTHWWWWPERL